MKSSTLILGILCCFFSALSAQTVENVSVGSNYANQTFYKLSDGQSTSSSHSDWHLAFSVMSNYDAAVFINEGAALSGNRVKLYSTGITSFATSIDTNTTTLTEIQNTEKSWEQGAFNETSTGSTVDYGWGNYNFMNHNVEGDEVFVLELPNGDVKKVMIDSLASGIYYFRYANLDGSNLQTQTIAKSNFNGQTLAYFSLTTNAVVNNVEPTTGWDLLFTRYETPVPDGNGGFLPYQVTGVLSNHGVAVAQANNVNVSTVDHNIYLDSLSDTTLLTIGSDWKYYDFTNGWSVEANRTYFVKTTADRLWKVTFVDFQGSGTGISTLQKTDLGTITSIDAITTQANTSLKIQPNPAIQQTQIVFDAGNQPQDVSLRLFNLQGQQVWQQELSQVSNLQAIELAVGDLPAGQYLIQLQAAEQLISQKITVLH